MRFTGGGVISHLDEAVTHGLGQVELASLVNEVKAPLPDLALVLDVDGIGRGGHCQACDSQEASQHLTHTPHLSQKAGYKTGGQACMQYTFAVILLKIVILVEVMEAHPAAGVLSRSLDCNGAPATHLTCQVWNTVRFWLIQLLDADTVTMQDATIPSCQSCWRCKCPANSIGTDPFPWVLCSPPWDGSAHCMHTNSVSYHILTTPVAWYLKII